MSKVGLTPWWWVLGGCLALALVGVLVPLGLAGWAAGLAYLIVSSALLSWGLYRHRAERFGAANAVTATRSVLVGLATALVGAAFAGASVTWPLVVIASVALALDGVDGWVARRTGTSSDLGARFDMEVDAFVLLALAVYDVRYVGWWVLAIGLMRYVFVAAGWVLPWMRTTLPPRFWRKVVTASVGVALVVVASDLFPFPVGLIVAGAALALLVESFGRDVVWLVRSARGSAGVVPAGTEVAS